MSYTICALPATMIDFLWEQIVPHIAKVVELAKDEISEKSIYDKAKSGDSLIVVVCKGKEMVAVLCLEVAVLDTGVRALCIPIIGGSELEGWMDQFLDVAKAIAKDLNCQQLRGYAARKGWMKVLKDWEEVCVVLKYELGD